MVRDEVQPFFAINCEQTRVVNQQKSRLIACFPLSCANSLYPIASCGALSPYRLIALLFKQRLCRDRTVSTLLTILQRSAFAHDEDPISRSK